MKFISLKKYVILMNAGICILEPLSCLFCKNGATCEATATSARCHCAEGYFGDGCGR